MSMKFALAAGVCAAALAGFSDVTSANVVGYMGKQTTSLGNVMITPMFDNVGSVKTFKLSDLRGANYDPEEGAWGDLSITILNSSGSADTFADGKYAGKQKKFFWFDCEEVPAPGWYDGNGEVAWDADSIVFNAGDAFWVHGAAQDVTVAGQVGVSDIAVGTPNVGNKATGNPFPVECKLSKIYCDGYDTEEGAWGDLSITILNTSGSAETFADGKYAGKQKKFFWFDCEEVPAAGWYDGNGEVAWDADSIVFAAGQGMWVHGATQVVHFPAPKLND